MKVSNPQDLTFPCPKCLKDGKKNLTERLIDGSYLCPVCGTPYTSKESAWPKNEYDEAL